MAVQVVQAAFAAVANPTTTITGVTAGNMVFVFVTLASGSNWSGVSASAGTLTAQYAVGDPNAWGDDTLAYVGYILGAPSGDITFTVAADPAIGTIHVAEYAGVSSFEAATAWNTEAAVTAATTLSLTPATNNTLAIAVVGLPVGGTVSAAGNSFAVRATNEIGGRGSATADRVLTSTASVNTALTFSTSQNPHSRLLLFARSAGASLPAITNNGDESHFHGETGVIVTGTGFGATQGSGKVYVSPTDNVNDAGRVEQTVTAWSDTSITFTAALSSFSVLTNLRLFVRNNAGQSNATGYVIQREPRVRLTDRLIDANGSALASQTGITAAIWRNGTGPTAAAPNPDQVIENVTTDGSGNLSLAINRGSLVSPNAVFVTLDRQGSPNRAFAGVVTPSYE